MKEKKLRNLADVDRIIGKLRDSAMKKYMSSIHG